VSTYDPHELRIKRRGVSIDKVIAAYKHFGSLRKAAKVCGISKDTVKSVIRRYNITLPEVQLPSEASYNPKTHYSDFAIWHKEHAHDEGLPHSIAGLAKLSGVKPNVVKCYFYRRRKEAREILNALPDLRLLDVPLKDIEGMIVKSNEFLTYRYAIDRYSERAAIQANAEYIGEVTILIPSIDQFASRIRKLTSEVEGPGASKSHSPSGRPRMHSRPEAPSQPEKPGSLEEPQE